MVWSHAFVNESQAVTDSELVAAPGAGKEVVVYGLHISSDIKESVTLESGGSTLVWKLYAGADNPEDLGYSQVPLFRCAENEALTVTTDAAGATFIAVTYRIEDAWTG